MGNSTCAATVNQQFYFQGPPRFDVGLLPIPLQAWLLPDDQATWIVGKNALIDADVGAVFCASPRSDAAQSEAALLVAREVSGRFVSDEPPLLAASRLVSDDLVIMEQQSGAWTTTACSLCSPTFFSPSHAIGKSLTALHNPVPDGDFGLAQRIGRIFDHLRPDTILERHNWTVQWSDARHTPDGTPLLAQAEAADTAEAQDNLFLRVERQTIRKLPNTGAILFTIRIRLTQLASLLASKQHRYAFEQAWQLAPEAVRGYKKWAVFERHVAALLIAQQ